MIFMISKGNIALLNLAVAAFALIISVAISLRGDNNMASTNAILVLGNLALVYTNPYFYKLHKMHKGKK